MARTLYPTKQLKRDAKKHYLQLLTPQWAEIINCLAKERSLPEKYKDHALLATGQTVETVTLSLI